MSSASEVEASLVSDTIQEDKSMAVDAEKSKTASPMVSNQSSPVLSA